jgi:rhodanese-related sulfurtransferase
MLSVPARLSPSAVRQFWRDGREIALLDVREEALFAQAHPFFAASLPLSRLECDVFARIPRKSAPIAVYDDGEGLAERAAEVLSNLGYADVAILDSGLAGYARCGELFRDVNTPTKAFGELVEAIRHTPSVSADEAARLIETEDDLLVLDARRFAEYRTMSIPGAISTPGGELVRRIGDLVRSERTTVIVNCAGRTRSIIGAQSLVNAGLPNPVFALRNGTIGWTLAGHGLDHGRSRRYLDIPPGESLDTARARAASWADRVGVRAIGRAALESWRRESELRTLHLLDVRAPEEYALAHPAGFVSAPGGQLVQALDEWVAVRGARLVLFDDDGVRARMAASWLVQMGWEAAVIGADQLALDESGIPAPPRPAPPAIADAWITPQALAADPDKFVILDLASSPAYRKAHIPGARFVIRSRFAHDLPAPNREIVLVSPDPDLARFAWAEAASAAGTRTWILEGGAAGWAAAGYPLTAADPVWLSPPEDVYKRPYEGTDNAAAAMQAYIDWELRLIAQLANDGVCNFRVV